MATVDIYGFAHEDLEAARTATESALSIRLEEAQEESSPGGCYFRWYVPDGPCVQLRRNVGPYQRWQGDSSHPWHPDFGVLVFVHGPARESIAQSLQHDVPGLSFLEKKETM
jgi:hypothetical protein